MDVEVERLLFLFCPAGGAPKPLALLGGRRRRAAARPPSASAPESPSSPHRPASPSTAEHRPVFLPSLLQRLAMDNSGKEKEAMQLMADADKKADPQEAINCLNQAIDIYTDMGRFTIAAKHHITIAEIYESELVDIEKAIAHYEQAADYYKGEESNSSANKCLLKVGHYSAQLEQYQKAIEIYEQVAMSTMDNPLLKYNAKEYFFKASLCHFIVDELNAKLAIEKYEEMFPAFTDSRELKLLKKLLEAHEEQNSEAFTEAVKEFDSVSRLDQWLTTMLLRIKKTIQGDAGDLK
uniref:NSF attachment protein beta n=1 Tax=Amphiprion ocellaris TaxID=80972 RepID=A0AAQ5YL16_AMPOC